MLEGILANDLDTNPLIHRKRIMENLERQGLFLSPSSVGCGLLFGGLFVVAGVWIALIGLKVIPIHPSKVHAPPTILVLIGLIFAIPGFLVMGRMLRQRQRVARAMDLKARHPDKPWLADHPWDPQGMSGRGWAPALSMGWTIGFLTLFLTPFNWIAFGAGRSPVFVKIIVGLFDLIWLVATVYALYVLGRVVKYGHSRLHYPGFPFHPGKTVELEWQAPSGLSEIQKGVFRLRLVEEYAIQTGEGENRNTQEVSDQLWEANIELPTSSRATPGSRVPLAFEIPAGLPTTKICVDPSSGERPRYYLLTVSMETQGIDFEEHYLVPLYDSPHRA